MKVLYLLHSTYDAFLADRDVITFTANVRGAKKFNSYNDAYTFGNNMQKDNKLSPNNWHVLAIYINQ